MKEIHQKQLTSNTFVNKLLLSNTQFNDWVNVSESHEKQYLNQFLTIIAREYDNQRLSKDELVDLLDNYFHILDHLLELTTDHVLFLIKIDYHLEVLAKHYDTDIHLEIARKGACLNIFVHHANPRVRVEVAKHRYRLDLLVHDEDTSVREQVAKIGYRLDLLLFDESAYVREEVVLHEYGLHYLLQDEDSYVRDLAKRLLQTRDW